MASASFVNMTFEQLIERQVRSFKTLDRYCNSAKQVLGDQLTVAALQNRLQVLRDTWESCVAADAQIHLLKSNEDDIYFTNHLFERAEEFFLKANDFFLKEITELQRREITSTLPPPTSSSSTHAAVQHRQVTPLPTINIPKFSGKPTEWATFRDYFTSLIIRNQSLDNLQKFHFLKSYLDGEASSLLKNIPLTENSFNSAWDRLKNRFDNPRAIIQAELKALFAIQSMKSDSVLALKSIRNVVTERIAALENLNRFSALTVIPENEDSPDGVSDILVFLISQKLDSNTRLAWELHLGNTVNYPHFSKFLEFIDSRIRAMEAVQRVEENKSRSDVVRSHVVSNNNSCPLCDVAHKLFACSEFKKKSAEQRFQFVKSKILCLNCLTSGHSLNTCLSSHLCAHCQSKHHTLLHFKRNSNANETKPSTNKISNASSSPHQYEAVEPAQTLHAVFTPTKSLRILLATAQVIVTSESGRSIKVRALLDQGSTWSFITEELANALRIRPIDSNIKLLGLANVSAGTSHHMAPIGIRAKSGKGPIFNTNALVLKRLTNYVPSIAADVLEQPHLQELDLADDELSTSKPIHILIGADLYGSILLNGLRKGRITDPVAQNTAFGWILSGKDGDVESAHSSDRQSSASVHHCISNETLNKSIQKFWEVEETPFVSRLTKSEEDCELHFQKTHSRLTNGRYVVRLPFKSGPPINIGHSRRIAEKSILSLSKKFVNSLELFEQYNTFMKDYETKGHMSQACDEPSNNSQIVYLPHHPVIRESSSTTKLRVVFNASSKTSNFTSLNDHMYIGPKLQANIFEITLLWRTFRFVYASDIAQMYRQILVDEQDRDYQRILWIPSIGAKPIDFRLNTVTYGTASAPYLALRVLRQLVKDDGASLPLASAVLSQQIYVDDCLFGADSKEEILKIRNEVVTLLEKGKFQLRKWASNSLSLLEDIDPIDHGLAIEKPLTEDDSLKILGIVWMSALDSYRFKIQLPEIPIITKRTVLSLIARLYDPFGWISPVVVIAKVFMQKLWLNSVKWDEPLPLGLTETWQSYYKDLSNLEKLCIPRWTGQGTDVVESSIHGFSDASNTSYAAVLYIRLVLKSGEIRTTLLTSRTKVAPLKTLSVPRLELSGALLLTHLVSAVKAIPVFAKMKFNFWTDSTIVLAWLNKHPSTWQTFVANRVASIQSVAPIELWYHVISEDNPADLGSRGVRASDLLNNQLWWKGPSWLSLPENLWPKSQSSSEADTEEEARARTHLAVVEPRSWLDELTSRISSWSKIIRIVAYVLKFLAHQVPFFIASHTADSDHSFSEFCFDSLTVCIRFVQLRLFQEEISLLQRKLPLPKSSALLSLNPFLDEKGILRVGGRLANAPLEFNRRYPVIVKAHPLVTMIVRHYHEKCLHGATQLTLSQIRQKFWILRSRQVIKSVIYNCLPCARLKATVSEQLMAALPVNRVSRPARPFTHVGVDYAGPIKLKSHKGRGHASHAAYIVVFVCFAIRAIHLELVSDYTAESFIAAFKRFVSRRGLPNTIYSDNGTNFKGAQRELAETFTRLIQDPRVRSYCANDQIRWKYIPPAAAHFGGIWESGVRSVKHHLKRVLAGRAPVYEELDTLLHQIEMCLNSRPLYPLTDDPENLLVLTPGHFLVGGELTAIPESSLLEVKENRLSRWQLWQQLLESFWKAWSEDYVLSLQQRNKWRFQRENLCLNQLVLVKNESLPPTKWALGRVIGIKKGSDELVRVATVRTASGTYVRPITKLALLPVKPEESSEDTNNE